MPETSGRSSGGPPGRPAGANDADSGRAGRERELASLYATARELTVLGEVDSVLASIVRHAHDLIGADVTYLSAFDESFTQLELRAVQGAISAGFRAARVPATTGVGGRVIDTRMPFWVSNYLTTTMEHHPEFDATLRAEGIVALLGVPLLTNDRVSGVLYAGDRMERQFSPDQVALLSAFADHAAVALENARLYDQSRGALAQLRSAYQTIEAQMSVMERSAAVHEALAGVILTGGGARDVAALLVDALGGRVTIVDRLDRTVVSHAMDTVSLPIDDETLESALASARERGRCSAVTARDGSRHTVAPILGGDSYLGAVLLASEEPLDAVSERTLERCAQIVGLLTLKQQAVVEAEERVRGELLTDVLSGSATLPEMRARASARGLDVDSFDTVLVVGVDADQLLKATRKLHELSEQWRGLAGQHLGHPALLLRTPDPEVTARSVQRALRASIRVPVLVVAASLRESLPTLGRAFTLAQRCARILPRVGVTDRGITTSQFGLYALLFDPDRAEDLESFVGETLGRLISYDRDRNTNLVETLAAYLDHRSSGARTAKALHIHINTLLKRLDRIASVLGSDWQDPDNELRIRLAVRFHCLAGEPSIC